MMTSQKGEWGRDNRDNRNKSDDQASRLRNPAIEQKLEWLHDDVHLIIDMLKDEKRKDKIMAEDLNELIVELKGNTSLLGSMDAALTAILAKLEEANNSGDPAKVAEALAEVRAQKTQINAAIIKGTPAAGGSTGGIVT